MSSHGKITVLVLLRWGSARSRGPRNRPAADPLDAALEQRIRGKADVRDVEIERPGRGTGQHALVKVWGSGVGIWQNRTQFRLSRDEVVSLLKILSAAKVGTMCQPGAKSPAAKTPAAEPPKPKSPLRLLGRLTVVAGSERKSLHQLLKGEQSEPLRKLVLAILSFCEKAAKDGVHRFEHAGRAEQAGRGHARAGDLRSHRATPRGLQGRGRRRELAPPDQRAPDHRSAHAEGPGSPSAAHADALRARISWGSPGCSRRTTPGTCPTTSMPPPTRT